jgi:hypothetical protein
MAKQYEDFKKEFAAISQEVEKCYSEIDKNERLIGQTSGIIEEGCKELGLRVQKLKDAGDTGKTIKDFEFDSEVKKILASLQNYLGSIQKELARIAAVHAGPITKVKARYNTLKKDLTAEIAARKKQASTKVGIGNKSLPDMVKLLDAVAKYPEGKAFGKVESFVPEAFPDHVSQFQRDVQRAIDQTKAVKLTAFQEEMRLRGLNPRVLVGNVGRAKTLFAAVMKQCKDVETAAQKSDAKSVINAKAGAVQPMRDLSVLVDPYEKAKTDSWIQSLLSTSKDKAKIEAGIEGMIKMRAQAREALQKVAHL